MIPSARSIHALSVHRVLDEVLGQTATLAPRDDQAADANVRNCTCSGNIYITNVYEMVEALRVLQIGVLEQLLAGVEWNNDVADSFISRMCGNPYDSIADSLCISLGLRSGLTVF